MFFIGLETVKDLARAGEFLKWQRRNRVRLLWRVGPIRERPNGPQTAPVNDRQRLFSKECELMLLMTDSQQADLSIQPVDRKGNPAPVEGVSWSSSDDTIVTVTVDATDPTKAVVKAVGPLGSAQVNVTADARIGEGTVDIAGVLDVTIVAGEAVSVQISAGTPTEQS